MEKTKGKVIFSRKNNSRNLAYFKSEEKENSLKKTKQITSLKSLTIH